MCDGKWYVIRAYEGEKNHTILYIVEFDADYTKHIYINIVVGNSSTGIVSCSS